ncbi:efflux RND transporter periplasmic adaptor subunit [Bradyrhizobium sp.]|uniref:efflux RND transporter periplasmic adaptor subunit n=1 Tax=Bradyrhizobium sp. TaxID=376 RepID=UPI0025BD9E68|nr:efflux RND transporter periplasmic adaptor subunit [Bradyrhizobium sp.]
MDMRLSTNAPPLAAASDLPSRNRRKLSWKLASAVLFAAAALAFTWWLLQGPTITVARVVRGAAAEIVYATGSVEPETWSRSTPLVRGRIIERCRCEGKAVKRGDILARLDDKEALATLNDLNAQEEFQRREFDRQSQLLSRGVATSQAFQKSESDLARVRAQIAAQAQRLEYYKLVAPMDGTVLKEDGEVGDMVEPGTILYRIGLEKPLWVVADVNEEDIPRVKVGQKALLRTDAFAGQVLPGAVKQITPAGDPVSKTFRVRIGLPDDTPLRVGMSVEANIVSREKPDVVLVPANAVVNNNLFAVEDGHARLRKVEIGIRGTGFVEILQGVSEGEWVASPATANIKNGFRVRTAPVETKAP